MNYSRFHFKNVLFYGVGLTIALSSICYFMLDLIIDFWWFSSLGYWVYFAIRDGYKWTVVCLVAVTLMTIFFLNFLLISKFIKSKTEKVLKSNNSTTIQWLKSRSIWFYSILSMLLIIPLVIPVYFNWEKVVLFFFSRNSGTTDPAYDIDISYYLFNYPVYKLLKNELLIAFSLLFTLTAIIYALNYWKNLKQKTKFPLAAKIHLNLLILVVVLIQGWSISLENIELLYENSHLPVFFGPGALEMQYKLPLIWISFFAFLSASAATIYFIHKHQGIKLITLFSLIYLASLGFKNFSWLQEVLNKYYIKANPLQAEKRFMQFNIDATINAFGLERVKKIEYPAISSLTPEQSVEISESLYNIPLWESDLLADVYEQVQSIRPFYSFTNIATDRYQINSKRYQVNLAARELNLDKLPKGSQTWKNRHLVYTHGYGMVMTPSGQIANQPMKWFLQNLTLNTEHPELQLTQPEIYYGLANYDYAIVPNNSPILASRDPEVSRKYIGSGGMSISTIFEKMIFSTYLKEPNILLSNYISSNSRLLIKRNIIDRIKTIAPFLLVDSSPYPVIIKNRIHWVLDAYTRSDLYPNVEPVKWKSTKETHNFELINYIRNSVKITVDAYNGSVNFYIVDKNDPLIDAYNRAYPTLFKNINQMPSEFFKHLSYPKALFRQQMKIFARFHQDTPETFYLQNERLQFVNDEPFYVTLDSFEAEDQDKPKHEKFMLVENFTPIGRQNLAWISIAGCFSPDRCASHYQADIYAYKFPVNLQIEGPAQIEALINQNEQISSQFSLWDQRGSTVIKGRIIIIPFEENVLYIQPVYLGASTKTGFPQLVRVIVTMNHESVMDTSLESAFNRLIKNSQAKQIKSSLGQIESEQMTAIMPVK